MPRRPPIRAGLPGSPFLAHVRLRADRVVPGEHPFTLPWLTPDLSLDFTTPITFFVGENGTGKSTLLEALAWQLGFGAKGGNRDASFAEGAEGHALGRALALAWRQKVTEGFFLRAETFFHFADYLEQAGSTFARYGGRSLHAQSHGEAFLALFNHRFEQGVYLLDEPEAALSPKRQLAFLRLLRDLTADKGAQFIIATHSPMLLTFPGARTLSFDDGLREVDGRQTEHVLVTRDFLNTPERFYRHLFDDEG